MAGQISRRCCENRFSVPHWPVERSRPRRRAKIMAAVLAQKSLGGAPRHGCQNQGVACLAPLDHLDSAAIPILDKLCTEGFVFTEAVADVKLFESAQRFSIHHQ